MRLGENESETDSVEVGKYGAVVMQQRRGYWT